MQWYKYPFSAIAGDNCIRRVIRPEMQTTIIRIIRPEMQTTVRL